MISRRFDNSREHPKRHKAIGKTHTGLRVGAHLLHVGLLLHHLLEVNVTTDGVLVTVLTGVDAGSIGGVALEGLEGVEVGGGTGGIGVPSGVDILLGGVVPALLVVLSVLEVEVGGETSASEGGGEGRGTGGQGKDGGGILELWNWNMMDKLERFN